MRYRKDAFNAVAGVRTQGHAHCGQERQLDSQDKPDSGSTAEW
jgi:hypothetical protein